MDRLSEAIYETCENLKQLIHEGDVARKLDDVDKLYIDRETIGA